MDSREVQAPNTPGPGVNHWRPDAGLQAEKVKRLSKALRQRLPVPEVDFRRTRERHGQAEPAPAL
jgi:hypothetical protein